MFTAKNLSPRKQTFLESEKPNPSYLADAELSALITHYQTKLNITIYLSHRTQGWEKEIQKLQLKLKPNETLGYIYAVHAKIAVPHFDVLILTRDKIIRPIQWNGRLFLSLPYFGLDEHLEVCDLEQEEKNSKKFPETPQKTQRICATLGLLHLKELLKNNAQQLKEFTLCFQYYPTWQDEEDEPRELCQFFFPSPQPLRYSEVNSYNKILVEILMNTEAAEKVAVKGTSFWVRSLHKILIDSIDIAKALGDQHILADNQKLLAALPEFRKKWHQEFLNADQKRAAMYIQNINFYLPYRNYKMRKKVFDTIGVPSHKV